MSPEQNTAVVAEILKAIEAADADAALAHMTGDVTWWVAGDLPISGDHDRAGVEHMLVGMTSMAAGPIKYAPVAFVAEGDRVSVEVDSEVDLTNGKHYTNKYHMAFEFDGEKVARVREYMDTKRVHDIMFG